MQRPVVVRKPLSGASRPAVSRPRSTKIELDVKVVPGASRDVVAGWLGAALKIRVSAPPERGKANAAVERLLARTLGLPGGDVRVVAGLTSPRKRVAIAGLSDAEVRRRLETALE